ncbi:MAG TPA: aspartate kinase, partial [Limnochordia bacterium]|nr:aspartate kinase [Limnochordia bacterium]
MSAGEGALPRIVVQKFGGTSVATEAQRRAVVERVKEAIAEGLAPVVVVSAMGRRGDPYATDTLLDLLPGEGPRPPERELALLMSVGEVIAIVVLSQALQAAGIASRALTGAQAGIVTDANLTAARVLEVRPERVRALCAGGVVPVIAGFQGADASGEVTTLGRGGSDTTAAVLGVALNAVRVDIFTDVDGMKTADPRLVPGAATLSHISYEEAAQMAHLGAKVVHPRAVEAAMQGR